METRRVYRGIEEAALTGRYDTAEYPHSFISRGLRYEYRELCDFRRELSVAAITLASEYGNDKLDAKKGHDQVRKLLDKAVDCMPYLSRTQKNGKTAKRKLSSDREKAVAYFELLSKKLTKEDIKAEYKAISEKNGVKAYQKLGGAGAKPRELQRIAKPEPASASRRRWRKR